MLLDAEKDTPPYWFVWHCEKCYAPKAKWVNDDTNKWGEWVGVNVVERQARKILINLAALTIFIDPVDDDAVDETLLEKVYVPRTVQI